MSHSFNGEKNEISTESILQKIDFKRNFTPLIRFDMTTKNIPIDIDLTFNNTLNIINGEGGDIERQTNDQVSLTFRYRQTTGFRIPVFFLRDFQVENEIDLSLKIGYDNSNTQFSEYDQDIEDFETIATLLGEKRIEASLLTNESVDLEGFPEVFEKLKQPDSQLKVLLEFD